MTKRCPKCQRAYSDQFRFCNEDGSALVVESPTAAPPQEPERSVGPKATEPKVADGNRWSRRPGEFAARLETSDLSALLNKGIVVEEGTLGLLFQDGKMVGSLPPGRHTVETAFERLRNLVSRRPVSVVLVDVSKTLVDVVAPQLRTSDDQLVDGNVQVVVAVNNPLDFFLNVMKGQEIVLVEQIASRLRDGVREIVEPIVVTCTADELYANTEIRERVELDLRQTLGARLSRLGLLLEGVDQVRFTGQAASEIRQRRGELNRAKAIAELDSAYREFQNQLASEASRQQMRGIKGDAEMSQFLKRLEHEVFRRDLLRQQERDELARQFRERVEDHEAKRSFVLASVELQRRSELARLEHNFQIEDLQREHAERLAKLQSNGQLDTLARQQEQTRLDEELSGKLRRANAEFEHEVRRQRESLELELTRRQRTAELEREQKQADQQLESANAQTAIDLYAKFKSAKQALAQGDRRFDHELQTATELARHQQELARMEKLNQLSPTAQIAAAPERQAELLADLRKTETLKGMDDSQIMALFAKDSPEIARALAEKFKAVGAGAANQHSEKAYERLLAEKDAMLALFQNMHRDVMRSQQELAQSALQTQRDTAVAAAGPRPSPPPVMHAAIPQLPLCSKCQSVSPSNSRFCQSCGTPFS